MAGMINLKKFTIFVLVIGCLAFGAALLSFAYTGTYARYWADDYCYNAALRAHGFWEAQVSFYQNTSDRYSVIPLVGISEWFGASAIRFLPLLAILLAVIGLVWSLGRAAAFAGSYLRFPERLLLAFGILFFTFWQAPNLFQVLYWRTGMLTYFMPLVVVLFLAGLILDRTWRRTLKPWVIPLVFLLAFFAGGFSETTAALQAGAFGLGLFSALAAVIRSGRMGGGRKSGVQWIAMRRLAVLLGVGLLGTLLAMLVLFLSPSNQLRLVHMPEPPSLMVLAGASLRFGFDFLLDSVATQPLPTLLSLLMPLLLGLAFQADCQGAPRVRRLIVTLAAVLLSTCLLIVCVCAPSVYVEVAYPEPRALIAARFTLVLGLAAAGWLGGSLIYILLRRARFLPRVILAGALFMLVLCALYPLRAAWLYTTGELPYFQQRAAGWDARDRQIQALIRQGQRKIQVPALDSMGGLMEINPDSGRFPNGCVAAAYGLQEITGIID